MPTSETKSVIIEASDNVHPKIIIEKLAGKIPVTHTYVFDAQKNLYTRTVKVPNNPDDITTYDLTADGVKQELEEKIFSAMAEAKTVYYKTGPNKKDLVLENGSYSSENLVSLLQAIQNIDAINPEHTDSDTSTNIRRIVSNIEQKFVYTIMYQLHDEAQKEGAKIATNATGVAGEIDVGEQELLVKQFGQLLNETSKDDNIIMAALGDLKVRLPDIPEANIKKAQNIILGKAQ